MLSTPESPKAVTTQTVQMSEPDHGRGKSDGSANIICDLADSDAFVESYRKPHVPVMSAFGAGCLHVCRLYGSWDLDKAASEQAESLFRSIRYVHSKKSDALEEYWDDLTFRFGPRSFIYINRDRIIGFAATPVEAERLAKNFAKAYRQPACSSGGNYYLIQVETHGIKCHKVTLPHTFEIALKNR